VVDVKYPDWDDTAGCCTGGVVGAEGGAETHAGGVDGLDVGAGACPGAGVAVEAGAGWVSGTDSSSGLSVKTDGALSVGLLTTRAGMGWAGGGAGTSSGADGAGVGPRADSVPSAEMTSPESGDDPGQEIRLQPCEWATQEHGWVLIQQVELESVVW